MDGLDQAKIAVIARRKLKVDLCLDRVAPPRPAALRNRPAGATQAATTVSMSHALATMRLS